MRSLLCDSGPLIAAYTVDDRHHDLCTRFLDSWPGLVLVPEPVLGETCSFLRNNVRRGPFLEAQLLAAMTGDTGDVRIVDPVSADRQRASELVTQLVSAPLGYVDATIVAMAERLGVNEVATIDYKLLGMAGPVRRIPLRWVLQEA